MVPESQAELVRVVAGKWKIRYVNQHVERIVGEYGEANQRRCLPVVCGIASGPGIVQSGRDQPPRHGSDQTMRDRVVQKFERSDWGVPWDDPGVFPSQQP